MSILKMHRMKRISSLDGLKAIMMLSIFCWHTPPNPTSPLGEPAADLGARACEVLIVAAGETAIRNTGISGHRVKNYDIHRNS